MQKKSGGLNSHLQGNKISEKILEHSSQVLYVKHPVAFGGHVCEAG